MYRRDQNDCSRPGVVDIPSPDASILATRKVNFNSILVEVLLFFCTHDIKGHLSISPSRRNLQVQYRIMIFKLRVVTWTPRFQPEMSLASANWGPINFLTVYYWLYCDYWVLIAIIDYYIFASFLTIMGPCAINFLFSKTPLLLLLDYYYCY